jgi:hypothetical protein
MTPQERQLVAELFDRLASLEPEPRDPDAERVIAEGFRRAPHAAYALVQTVLVQDEALKRANARIEELQAMGAEEPPRQGGFLDNMRDTLLGRDDRRGSVPSVRAGGLGSSGVWGPGPAAGARRRWAASRWDRAWVPRPWVRERRDSAAARSSARRRHRPRARSAAP